MAFQTTITRSPVVGFEGGAADSNPLTCDSKVAKTTLAPGRAVRVDAADAFELVTVPTAATHITGAAAIAPVLGVTLCDTTQPANPYVAGDPVPVVRQGTMWVICEDAVSPALPVYIRHTTDASGTVIGGFRASAATGAALAAAGFRWVSTTTAVNQLAKLEINLP